MTTPSKREARKSRHKNVIYTAYYVRVYTHDLPTTSDITGPHGIKNTKKHTNK